MTPEIPVQHRDTIGTHAQKRRDLHQIAVASIGRWPALESAFAHDQCAVNPQKIFAIERDIDSQRGGHIINTEPRAPGEPLVAPHIKGLV